ncbi:MAG TPA: hypothetical protein PLW48_04240 [Alphaproteobacteria bacterium]|nr:hypothetical protein [Rhodospirillaceae bacterium]HRJ66324.1 hypothetical protein [Alphaproteobacteria bacterium]
MDKNGFEKLVAMMASDNDSDAVMGLRGFQAWLREENVPFAKAAQSVFDNLASLRAPINADSLTAAPQERGAVKVSGMPQCVAVLPGIIMIIPPGQTEGEKITLPGAAAAQTKEIADGVKDVLVAAVINKSRFKLKLVDIKDKYGEVVETVLQGEFDRDNMQPVKVWANVKGETAALATVLRRAVAAAVPDLVA